MHVQPQGLHSHYYLMPHQNVGGIKNKPLGKVFSIQCLARSFWKVLKLSKSL